MYDVGWKFINVMLCPSLTDFLSEKVALLPSPLSFLLACLCAPSL